MQAPVQHVLLHAARRVDLHMQADFGRHLAELANRCRQRRVFVGQGRFDHAEAQHAGKLIAQRAGFHLKRVDRTEQTLRGGVQLRAFFCEPETRASAFT